MATGFLITLFLFSQATITNQNYENPFMTFLRVYVPGFKVERLCPGAIISREWVLTAGGCLSADFTIHNTDFPTDPRLVTAYVGVPQLSSYLPDGGHSAASIIKHISGLVLVHLEKEIEDVEGAVFIIIARDAEWHDNSGVFTSIDGPQRLIFAIETSFDCNNTHCSAFRSSRVGQNLHCLPVSGGALRCENHLVGVAVSSREVSKGCITIFIDVHHHISWIRMHVPLLSGPNQHPFAKATPPPTAKLPNVFLLVVVLCLYR